MSKNHERLVFEIDEISIPISVIWIHYQRNPFPGGHRYRLQLPESIALVLAERLGRPITTDVSDEPKEVLFWLGSIFSDLLPSGRSEEMETQYVINSVSSTVLNKDGSLDIYGVCSPFLKGR